jgi:GH24 family phage-related lysozyme (muramidase)
MTLDQLRRSLAAWQKKLRRRQAKHRFFIQKERAATTPEDKAKFHELRAHWSDLVDNAEAMVARRKRQIAAQNTEVLDDRALDFLVREEGFIPYAYNDPVGHATFGVGHLIHKGPVTDADRRKWGTRQNPKTRKFVLDVFEADLDKYEKTVRVSCKPKLRQHEFAACTSLCFNIGQGGFAESTVVKKINLGRGDGHFVQAANAFLLWDNPDMLRPRRERERRLFLTGNFH